MTADEEQTALTRIVISLENKLDKLADVVITKDLFRSEINRLDGVMKVYAEYSDQKSATETARVNAIREVSDIAVKVAYDAAVEQAALLAKQVLEVASTLRDLVAKTADASSLAFQQTNSLILTRLTKLEEKQSEYQGGLPAMSEFVSGMKVIREEVRDALSKSKGANMLWVYIIGALAVANTIISIIREVTP